MLKDNDDHSDLISPVGFSVYVVEALLLLAGIIHCTFKLYMPDEP